MRRVVGGSGWGHVEVYVLGSAFEGRLTTDCDIGVVAAMRSPPVGGWADREGS